MAGRLARRPGGYPRTASAGLGRGRWLQHFAPRRKVAGSALTTPHFLLLFAAMLVAAAGNTALQSVMPAIGRAIGIADFYVAVAYTSSAVLWVLLAPFWARMSDRHGRKALTLLGVGGFIVSMTAVRDRADRRARRAVVGRADLPPVRPRAGDLRLARLRHAQRDPGLSRLAHPPLGAGRRRCRRCRRASGSARSSARRWRRCSCCRSSACPDRCSPSR